jgi:mannose-6-phosphate isomerase-like protein (cupin superfamily)
MTQSASMKINLQSARHYNWGDGCDGWVLLPRADMTAIQERMPPGTQEQRHHHMLARQFFYILSGSLQMEIDGEVHMLAVGDSIEVPPMARHQAANVSDGDVSFLVISSPSTHGDRVDEL